MKTLATLLLICTFSLFSVSTKAVVPTTTNPSYTLTPSKIVADQPVKITFDITGTGFAQTDNLYWYCWSPSSISTPLTHESGNLFSITFTPTTYYGKTFAEIALNGTIWSNVQKAGTLGTELVSGTIGIPVGTQTTTSPLTVTSTPANYTFDQPVTWTIDMTGSAFTAGQDLYMFAWSPSTPEAFSATTAASKMTYVSGMTWSKTLTPTTYFNKTISEITASAGFWMKLKDLAGKIESNAFNVSFATTAISATTSSAVSVYPNPVTNEIRASLNGVFTTATLYDFKGTMVAQQNIEAGASHLSINVASVPNGIYMLSLKGSASTETIKVVKR